MRLLKETKLADFNISKITQKAIDDKGLNDPVLVMAHLQDQDLELLFEVNSTAEDHHKVDLKGNTKNSSRGYAVVLKFLKAKNILTESKPRYKNKLYEYTVDESLRNKIIERLPSVLKDFNIKNEKLIDKLFDCLDGKKDSWKDKLTRVFKSFGIQKCDDIIEAILLDDVKNYLNASTLKTKLNKIINNCDVVVHCDCPAFYYQGMQQDDDTNGNARYKFQGTSGEHKWSLIHSKAGGSTGRALCKHLQAVKDWLKIKNAIEEIANELLVD